MHLKFKLLIYKPGPVHLVKLFFVVVLFFWMCLIHALKVDVDYGGDGSMLTDMVRGTFEIDGDIVDLYNILHELIAMPELSASIAGLEGIKDRYSRGN